MLTSKHVMITEFVTRLPLSFGNSPALSADTGRSTRRPESSASSLTTLLFIEPDVKAADLVNLA